ncbi:hypothetical protein IJG89_03745 [Candidatus Saccharibacteria bacterium]|nr:hypothetical protein [Candidatus Saccharibacteria bacterium]
MATNTFPIVSAPGFQDFFMSYARLRPVTFALYDEQTRTAVDVRVTVNDVSFVDAKLGFAGTIIRKGRECSCRGEYSWQHKNGFLRVP